MVDEVITHSWMRQLGIADGAAWPAMFSTSCRMRTAESGSTAVSLHALGAIARLAGDYRQRGRFGPAGRISWRVSCATRR